MSSPRQRVRRLPSPCAGSLARTRSPPQSPASGATRAYMAGSQIPGPLGNRRRSSRQIDRAPAFAQMPWSLKSRFCGARSSGAAARSSHSRPALRLLKPRAPRSPARPTASASADPAQTRIAPPARCGTFGSGPSAKATTAARLPALVRAAGYRRNTCETDIVFAHVPQTAKKLGSPTSALLRQRWVPGANPLPSCLASRHTFCLLRRAVSVYSW